MRAELRRLLITRHDQPDDAQANGEAFCVSLRAMIGPHDAPGEESFDFDVCSPAWLVGEVERNPVVSGRFLLIAASYEPKQIEAYVRKRIDQTSGDDWPMIAAKLGRWSQWEFEDYQER